MKVVSVKSFSEKATLLKSFKPKSQTWIVSDLQSKWEIQKKFLSPDTVLDENSILRASEFWTKILFRLDPATKVISPELMNQWIWSWLKKNPNSWTRVSDSAKSIRLHLEFFAPIFSQDNYEILMEEWFEKNTDSLIRWRHLYEVCRRIWLDLNEEKILTISLVPSRLLEMDIESTLWDGELIFDLGPDSLAIEKTLVNKISNELTCTWVETDLNLNQFKLEGELIRLPTQLGEVKEAVAQVRLWLDQGVSPNCIGVFAPDIEKYWPSFHQFLKVEGVPVQKPLLQKLVDDPKIQAWMAHLKVALGQFSKEDLESHYFQSSEFLSISTDDFRRYFSSLNEPHQAKRYPNWKATSGLNLDEKLTLLGFMEWALRFWPESFSQESLDRVWKALSKDHFDGFLMSSLEWISYFDQRLAKAEQVIEEESSEGIHLFSFSSGEWVEISHLVTLGLSEQELKRPSELVISAFEADRLKQDLGFDLQHGREENLEKHLAWVSSKDLKFQFHLSSGVNFLGEDITPSKYWLKSAYQNDSQSVKKIRAPRPTRWDELALSFEPKPLAADLVTLEKVSLSATSIRSYFECPFIFFAQKVLKLSDQPALDFDLDPMTKGSLMHKLFEQLVVEWGDSKWSEETIGDLLDSLRVSEQIEIGDERIWPATKKDLIQLGLRFLDMERDWRAKLPELKTIGQEVPFECDFNESTKEIHPFNSESKAVRLSGKIDRIDRDSHGEAALVDYKSTPSRLTGWSYWRGKGDYQMALYTMAVEKGLIPELEPLPVQAAYYHVPKTKERHRGFFLRGEGLSPTLYADLPERSRSAIDSASKQKWLAQSLDDISEIAQKIRSGEFLPKPRDTKICPQCRWSKLCRAPHLI